MDILKIVIPLITFILGVISTYFIKQRQNSKDRFLASIQEVAQLTNDWYNQLFSIENFINDNKNRIDAIEQKMVEYSQNRLILPSLLRHLEILKQSQKYNQFVLAAEEFLEVVSQKEMKDKDFDGFRCHNWPIEVSRDEHLKMLKSLLLLIDNKLQKVNAEAGRALGRS